jgi:hypothetical protein
MRQSSRAGYGVETAMRRPALIENMRVVPVRGEGRRDGDHISDSEQAPAEYTATSPASTWDISASDRLDGLTATLLGPPGSSLRWLGAHGGRPLPARSQCAVMPLRCGVGRKQARSLVSHMIRSSSMVTCIPLPSGRWAPACASAVRDIAALPVQPLGRAVLVEQADRNTQHGGAPLAGQLLGWVHQERGHALPPGTARPRRAGGPAECHGPGIRQNSTPTRARHNRRRHHRARR